MNIYANGRSSGFSVDMAESCTRFSAFWQGYGLSEVNFTNPIGGRQLDKVLTNLMLVAGVKINSSVFHDESAR